MTGKLGTDTLAKIIWDYHHVNHELKKADMILCLCSLDTRVAERAAWLWLDGYGEYLIFSGGSGKLTQNVFKKPEAEIFAAVAEKLGVPQEKILLENESTNTGENILFSYNLIQKHKLNPKTMILVQKPYMERRTYTTFKKQWPGLKTEIMVTSPQITFEDYFNEINSKELVINIMVGDLQRIKEYASLGYQIKQSIPKRVWSANEGLIKRGYTKHLIGKS